MPWDVGSSPTTRGSSPGEPWPTSCTCCCRCVAERRFFVLPTILAWKLLPPTPTVAVEPRTDDVGGNGKIETADFPARLPAAAQLQLALGGFSARVRRTLPPACGNPS